MPPALDPAVAGRPVSGREPALDVAKGLAIVAIVAGHVLRGLAGADLIDPASPLFHEVDDDLYLTHLPVFAVAAGLVMSGSLERVGVGAYVRSRALLFGWLYLVWSVLQGLVKLATGSLVNTPVTVAGLLEGLWRPDTQLWYLPLALLVSLAAATRPWRRPWWRAAAALSVAALVSLLDWGVPGSVIFTQGLGLTGCFALGAVLGLPRVATWARAHQAAGWGLAGAGLVGLVGLARIGDPTPPTSAGAGRSLLGVALGVVAVAGGVLATAGAAVALLRVPVLQPVGRVAAALGRASLPIYLAHIVVAAGLRIVLARVGIRDVAVHLTVGVLAGVLVPYLASRVAGGAPWLSWLFEPPRWLAGRIAGAGAGDMRTRPSAPG